MIKLMMDCSFFTKLVLSLLSFFHCFLLVFTVTNNEKFYHRPELSGKVCPAEETVFTQTGPSKIACMDVCSLSSTCKSVSYRATDSTCVGCSGIYSLSSHLLDLPGNIFYESDYHKDECASSPCHNGAKCIDGVYEYTCACSDGWAGTHCETDVNECESSPCVNEGTCVNGQNKYTCTCASGWMGTNCEQDVNECDSNPCLNGATCVNELNKYTCTCTGGWIGTQCEQDVNECDSNPCVNGGTCVNGENMYTCTCASGWMGTNCDQDVNECDNNPCLNGATCANGQNMYTCTCESGWTGTNCDQDVNECDNNPCLNGATCVNGQNMYTCTCASGWTGTNCDQDVNECDNNPCLNGATCVNGQNMYTCTCASGWTGTNCDQDVNECDSNPCSNGATCVNGQNMYSCTCASGWTGTNCEQDVNECDNNPCLNGATCVNGQNMYTCNCASGWTGTNCDQAPGTRFVTGFVNAGIGTNQAVPQLLIVSSVTATTNVYVTIPYLGISNEHHELQSFLLLDYPISLVIVSANSVTSNGVEVTSDQPITLFSLIGYTVVGGGTLELPTSVLGQLYTVDIRDVTGYGYSDILVVAMNDLTDVTFVLPSGTSFTITLNNLEAYRREATTAEPLAGTMISASNPVVVHAGHPCANIPSNVDYCDVLVATVPPEMNLGRKFVVPYLKPRPMYSIGGAAPHDNTNVKIYDGSTGTQIDTFTLNKGDSFIRSYSNENIILVEATQKMLLSQYSHGYSAGSPAIGDPSLLYVPAITQFGNSFHFVVPGGYVDGRVSVVLDTSSFSYDPLGFKLNGSPAQCDANIYVTVSSIGAFHVCYIGVSVGVKYHLTHTEPAARFGAMFSAYNGAKVFMTALGYDFSN